MVVAKNVWIDQSQHILRKPQPTIIVYPKTSKYVMVRMHMDSYIHSKANAGSCFGSWSVVKMSTGCLMMSVFSRFASGGRLPTPKSSNAFAGFIAFATWATASGSCFLKSLAILRKTAQLPAGIRSADSMASKGNMSLDWSASPFCLLHLWCH